MPPYPSLRRHRRHRPALAAQPTAAKPISSRLLTSCCAGLGNTGAASPASSPCGCGAAQLIVDTVNAAPGEVTLLALASLTNVALALHLDPSIAGKLKSLLYLGGAFFVMGNVNPATEANVWRVARPRQAAPPLTLTRSPRRGRHDPEAADWVLGAFPDGVTRVVGLDVTTRSVMSGSDLDELRAAGGRFCEYAWSICQFYKSYHQRSMSMDGIFLHDPTAFIAVIRPDLFTWTEGSIRVAVEGCARGKTLLDSGSKKWVCENSWMERPKCRVALELDAPGVLAQILERLRR